MRLRNTFIIILLMLNGALFVSATPASPDNVPLSTTAFTMDAKGENLFLVQKTANRVDLVARADAKILYQWHFSESPTGIVVKGDKAYVTSSFSSGFLTVIDIPSKKIEARIKLDMGAINPIINKMGTKLYVCNQYANTLSEVDLLKKRVSRTVALLREPVGAVLSADEKYLYVSNFLPDQQADLEVVASKVSVIDIRSFKRVKDILLANGSNALRGICLSPEGRYVFVSHNLGRFQVPTSQLQQGWMNTSGISIISTEKQSYMGTVLVDEPEYGAAGTWGIACDEETMVVSHSGTHDISVIHYPEFIRRFEKTQDKEGLSYDLRFLNGIRKRIPVKGNGPREVLLDNQQAIVPTYFSDSLNFINLENDKIQVFDLNPSYVETVERKGERLFNDASYCFQGWQSCNGCHPGDARTDGLNWDLLNDGIGNPKNCKSLLLAHETPPAMISGIRPDAETAVRAGFIHIQFTRISDEHAEAVDQYLKSLKALPSPYLVDGKLSDKAQRGKKVFQKAQCAYCHSGPLFTDKQRHKIGATEFEAGWDTPTLIEVWRTAPYLFDGRAETLEVLFREMRHGLKGAKLKKKEVEDLIEYVKSL